MHLWLDRPAISLKIVRVAIRLFEVHQATSTLVLLKHNLILHCRQYTRGGVCETTARLDGKVAIITGANTGVGKSNVLDFIQRGSSLCLSIFNLFNFQLSSQIPYYMVRADLDKLAPPPTYCFLLFSLYHSF